MGSEVGQNSTLTMGQFCTLIYTYHVTKLQMPVITSSVQQLNTNYINQLGPQIWRLYYHGVFAAIIAAIAEVIIFGFIFKKSSNFFISTVTSVIIILLVHNTITDYPLLKSDPNAWKIIFNGVSMNVSVMMIYAAIISIILYILKRNSTASKI